MRQAGLFDRFREIRADKRKTKKKNATDAVFPTPVLGEEKAETK